MRKTRVHPGREGFALLELLVSLVMLSAAILAIGTSSLTVLRLEQSLDRDAAAWRLARSLIALHRVGQTPEQVSLQATASGATLVRRAPGAGGVPDLPAGWETWIVEPANPQLPAITLLVRVLPPAAANGPAASKPPPPP